MLEGLGRDDLDDTLQHGDAGGAEQQGGDQRLECGAREGAIGASLRAHRVCLARSQGEQCREVVAQHLGGKVLLHGEVSQA